MKLEPGVLGERGHDVLVLAETRAILLDTTCRAPVASEWATEQYFLECGDMLPDAPDTIEDEDSVALRPGF